MDYDEIYKVIARFANDKLHLFADRWERWPEGRVASEIAICLQKKAELYERLGKLNTAEIIVDAAETLRINAWRKTNEETIRKSGENI